MDARLAQEAPASSALPSPDAKQSLWFKEEVLPHEPALRSWLKARFPTLSESDDVVQESYVRLFRSAGKGRVANAKSYLFAVARNVALDLFRRHRAAPVVRASEDQQAEVPEDRAGVAESACMSQEFEILREAIDSLPERCREIMILQKIRGLSNQEIADRLGLSIHTVNAQLVNGLARCRKHLVARGVLEARKA